MAEKKVNLSNFERPVIKMTGSLQIGILVSEWNPEITHALRDAAVETLISEGVSAEHIIIEDVPGSFELPLAAKMMAEAKSPDAILCLGCVIQGETRHFDFISQAVAQGILNVGLEQQIPVIFGVLTTNNFSQAQDRAGGKHGNKGVEAAVAALKMIGLKQKLGN